MIKKHIKPKILSNASLSNSIFKGKMLITTRMGQFTYSQAKVIEIVIFAKD